MSKRVTGELRGLGVSEKRELERLYRRDLAADELVSLPLARELYRIAENLRRRVGLLVSREGHIEEVFVGTKDILYLPELGRTRLAGGRLRRLRLIFSDLSTNQVEPQIPHDIVGDLQKLRLDAVVSVKEIANRVAITFATIAPPLPGERAEREIVEQVPDLGQWSLDFSALVLTREAELSKLHEVSKVVGPHPALLVGVYPKSKRDVESRITELRELARTAGVTVADVVVQRRDPDPRTLLGKGKLEEVVLRALRLGAELLIVDAELRPGQWRAITNATELKVIDRSMLILDIFAGRATSSDGRLQVELAQLKYNLPRLVEQDSGLSRLSGGIGGRGPGETKLELGRRRIRDRIAMLERQIGTLGGQRALRRQQRQEAKLPVVSIVGYTNAGKSTLFNALSRSNVLAENKLFATLDPAERRVELVSADSSIVPLIVSDTVGFIRELPKELRTAFRATLESIGLADILLHVVDASDPDWAQKKKAVERTLEEMGVSDIPVIVVYNKCDAVADRSMLELAQDNDTICISATTGSGLPELRAIICQRCVALQQAAGAAESEEVGTT